MVRKITFAVGLVMSLLPAQRASAVPITPLDLDSWMGGALFGESRVDTFKVEVPIPGGLSITGLIHSNVFFDGTQYTYVHSVDQSLSTPLSSAVRSAWGVHGNCWLELLGRPSLRRCAGVEI